MECKNTSSGVQNKTANGKAANFTSDNCKSTRNNIQMVDSKMNNSNNITSAGGDMYVTNNYYGLNADDVRLLLTMIRRQQEQIDKLMSLLNVEINQNAKKIETISRRLEVK